MSPRSAFNIFIHDKFTHGNFYFNPLEHVDLGGDTVLFILLLDDLMDDEQKMPDSLCGLLNMPINSSYASAAHKIVSEMDI